MIRINLLGAPKGKEQAIRSFGGRRHGSGRRRLAEAEGPGGAGAGWPGQRGLLVPAGQTAPGHRHQDGSGEQKNANWPT